MEHRKDIGVAMQHLLLGSLVYGLLTGSFVGGAVQEICVDSTIPGPGRDPQVCL